jgi:hypothetical protein
MATTPIPTGYDDPSGDVRVHPRSGRRSLLPSGSRYDATDGSLRIASGAASPANNA